MESAQKCDCLSIGSLLYDSCALLCFLVIQLMDCAQTHFRQSGIGPQLGNLVVTSLPLDYCTDKLKQGQDAIKDGVKLLMQPTTILNFVKQKLNQLLSFGKSIVSHIHLAQLRLYLDQFRVQLCQFLQSVRVKIQLPLSKFKRNGLNKPLSDGDHLKKED